MHQNTISRNLKVAIVLAVTVVAAVAVSTILLLQSLNQNDNGTVLTESLDLLGGGIWVRNTFAEAAIVVVNNGEKLVTFEKIVVCGVESEWTNIYYWISNDGPVSSGLEPTAEEMSGAAWNVSIGGSMRILRLAANKLTLLPQQSIVLYINDPGNLTELAQTSIPQSGTITIITQNKLYYKEVGVDVTLGFMGSSSVTVTNVQFTTGVVTLSVKNTGTKTVTIATIKVNNAATTFAEDGQPAATLLSGSTTTLTVALTWYAGNPYKFDLFDTNGQVVGSYQATAF